MCFEQKLIVEIDSSQHLDNPKDVARDALLCALGFGVLRFWNNEIFDNLEGVLTVILKQLQIAAPFPNPLPQGARERE